MKMYLGGKYVNYHAFDINRLICPLYFKRHSILQAYLVDFVFIQETRFLFKQKNIILNVSHCNRKNLTPKQ